jgi:hypothetical protein
VASGMAMVWMDWLERRVTSAIIGGRTAAAIERGGRPAAEIRAGGQEKYYRLRH